MRVLTIAHSLINRRKPLGRVAIDDRSLRAPRVWIAVLDLAACHKAANFDQFVDNCLIRITLATFAVQDIGATKKRKISPQAAIVHDVIGDDLLQHVQVAVQLILVHPVGWGAVHKTSSFCVGDKLSRAEIACLVPFAI